MLKWIKRMLTKQPEICDNKVDMEVIRKRVEEKFKGIPICKEVWVVGSSEIPVNLIKAVRATNGNTYRGFFTQPSDGFLTCYGWSENCHIPLDHIVAYHCGKCHWRKS